MLIFFLFVPPHPFLFSISYPTNNNPFSLFPISFFSMCTLLLLDTSLSLSHFLRSPCVLCIPPSPWLLLPLYSSPPAHSSFPFPLLQPYATHSPFAFPLLEYSYLLPFPIPLLHSCVLTPPFRFPYFSPPAPDHLRFPYFIPPAHPLPLSDPLLHFPPPHSTDSSQYYLTEVPALVISRGGGGWGVCPSYSEQAQMGDIC